MSDWSPIFCDLQALRLKNALCKLLAVETPLLHKGANIPQDVFSGALADNVGYCDFVAMQVPM